MSSSVTSVRQEKSMQKEIYVDYIKILKEELIPAMGCTEPIALAYAASLCEKTLGEMPEKCQVKVSGNLVKNVKSVIVPNTGGLKGIEAAIAAGIIANAPCARLEVLSKIKEEQYPLIVDYLKQYEINVDVANTEETFYIDLEMNGKEHRARVVMMAYHTNVVLLEKDGIVQKVSGCSEVETEELTDRSCLNVKSIIEFARTVDLENVRECLERQIEYNMAIAEEGIRGKWGAEVGKTYLAAYGSESTFIKAKAYAAAGSDARMAGCGLPVVIVSGSGNQGMTASVPVIVFAREEKKSEEDLLRALIISNLVTIHQKTSIGRLSAFCGAVSAGVGAAAGIAFLNGGDYAEISHTIVNALAILSGMTCDGAKASCAAKIAAAVDAGYFGYQLYLNGNQFYAGDGIITEGVEHTIQNVGRLAREGMRETDKEILSIMVGK